MRTNRTVAIAVVMAMGLVLLLLLPSRLARTPARPDATSPAVLTSRTPAVDQGRPATAAASCIAGPREPDPGDTIRFPDGSLLPGLNGVARASHVPWRTGETFAAVVGTETGRDGRQWYVHRDGARSTSFASRGTRRVVTQYLRPAPVHEVLPGP